MFDRREEIIFGFIAVFTTLMMAPALLGYL